MTRSKARTNVRLRERLSGRRSKISGGIHSQNWGQRLERKAQRRRRPIIEELQRTYALFPARARAGFCNPFLTKGGSKIYAHMRARSGVQAMLSGDVKGVIGVAAAGAAFAAFSAAGEVLA